jgi:hypothetical protein
MLNPPPDAGGTNTSLLTGVGSLENELPSAARNMLVNDPPGSGIPEPGAGADGGTSPPWAAWNMEVKEPPCAAGLGAAGEGADGSAALAASAAWNMLVKAPPLAGADGAGGTGVPAPAAG